MIKILIKCPISHKSLKPNLEKKKQNPPHEYTLISDAQQSPVYEDIIIPLNSSFSAVSSLQQKSKGPEK